MKKGTVLTLIGWFAFIYLSTPFILNSWDVMSNTVPADRFMILFSTLLFCVPIVKYLEER